MASRNRRSTEFSKREPTYKPKYARLVGSVTGAILLKQIAFWYGLKHDKPFYKFNAPCKHELYEEGDSWEEELGFTRCELNGARAKIGTKITQDSGLSKGDILAMDTAEFDEHGQMTNADKLVIYWTDAERVTWYILNEDLLEDALRKLDLMQDFSISRKSRKSALAGNAENPHYPITEKTPEKTPEKTTETTLHIEKPNAGFSRAPEHPQAQQPAKRTTKQVPLSKQAALFEPSPSVSVEPPPSQPQVPQQQRKPNAMYDAICLAWKTEGGMAGKIQQQLLGKMPKKHPHHASNFAEPATPDEVASFAKWYRNRYPGCDMPMSPEKIQHHFAAFRRETGEAAKKNAPKIREQNGRRLKYDSTLQSWLDIGPAQVPPQSFNRSQNEAYAQ